MALMFTSINGSLTGKPTRNDIKTMLLYAELRAAELHAEHGYSDLDSLPVDATLIAKEEGAEVYRGDLDDEPHEGFLYVPRHGTPEITVRQNAPYARRRFIVAHELGYLIHVREISLDEEAGHVDGLDTIGEAALSGGQQHGVVVPFFPSVENFANSFAAALLMPRPLTLALLKSGASTKKLAMEFHVSDAVAAYRVQNLHAIAPSPLHSNT
jgi:Zn-dependent peptidase ImmA (M78 family)